MICNSKTLKFQKGGNSSHWSLYADTEAAIQNVLQNRCFKSLSQNSQENFCAGVISAFIN